MYAKFRSWTRLSHPFVLPFLGVDGELFPWEDVATVIPWMRHGTVLQWMKLNPRSSAENVVLLLLQIAEGLNYLHAEGIFHGDIRGENIFIDDNFHPRLAHFGHAIITQSSGLPRWLAPELQSGTIERGPNMASDVHSYGRVCLELWTGQKPFHDIVNEVTVIRKVARGERPDRPSSTDEHTGQPMPDELWNLIEKCWSPEPRDRPTMGEVIQEMKIIHTTLSE
ncbi:hypothetical protein JAAARDRAFT_175539 [Jaapia argillacea MUCL 33604]|uniref:Protein kinase domain-containing protein n=1 Tax=Jaapia argillacea MUCL 33604 TaxID=933084 RepID=A0A067PYD5_9AGAM|nr:hypothetical protein JAAARDRAFT_175539 [Jaapia argillacea MUCL 33604]